MEKYVFENIPSLRVLKGDATYLVWMDVSSLTKDASEFVAFLREKTGLVVSDGGIYGKGGESFLRLNIACPKKTLEDGLDRLRKGVELFLEEKGK